MKVVNRHLVEQHEEMLRRVKDQAPKPITVTQHPEDEAPKVLGSGVVVMGGDYYTDEGIVIAAADVGEGGGYIILE